MPCKSEIIAPEKLAFNDASNGMWFALTDGATITPDVANGDFQYVTLGGNRTFAAPLNPPTAASLKSVRMLLRIRQDGTGSRTITWNAIYRFPNGITPILTTAANKSDYFSFLFNEIDTKWDLVGDRYNL